MNISLQRAKIMIIGAVLLVTGGLFLIPNPAQAELSYPYKVDEKPRVLFGDSAEVTTPTGTYYGLENYHQDYQNGYAHFSYTYTHTSYSYTSYPPVMYLTEVDPRTTKKAQVKTGAPLMHLYPQNTNWYSYDIQFDASGCRVLIKEEGTTTVFDQYYTISDITDLDWISILNYFPASNEYSMAFTPVPVKDQGHRIDPVIIIPGILGSAEKDGKWIIDPIFHVYDNLIETLKSNGYTEGVNLFTFGYDWRKSNDDTAALLEDKVNEVKGICNCRQVNLVAHSMGGLVAARYVSSYSYTNEVKKIVFLGTPFKGAPKDYAIWEAGEFPERDLITWGLQKHLAAEAKEKGYTGDHPIFDYIHSWPITSVQELLPANDYLKDAATSALLPYPTGYPVNYFLSTLSVYLPSILTSGIDVTNIFGNTGSNTISTIRITHENKWPLWQHGYPEGYDNALGDRGLEKGPGDGTVPKSSAALGISNDIEINSAHAFLPTNAEQLIYDKIHGGTLINPVKKLPPLKSLWARIFSPADFVITAPDGKRVGKDFATNQEVNEIPGAFYSGFSGDDEYVTIPDPIDGKYTIELKGTGNGSYRFETSYISDEGGPTSEYSGTITTNEVQDLSVTLNSQTPTELPPLELVITINTLIADINDAYTKGWIADEKTRDLLLKKANSIVKLEDKNTPKTTKKIDKILTKLMEKDLDKLLSKEKITQEGYTALQEDLQYLYNNN